MKAAAVTATVMTTMRTLKSQGGKSPLLMPFTKDLNLQSMQKITKEKIIPTKREIREKAEDLGAHTSPEVSMIIIVHQEERADPGAEIEKTISVLECPGRGAVGQEAENVKTLTIGILILNLVEASGEVAALSQEILGNTFQKRGKIKTGLLLVTVIEEIMTKAREARAAVVVHPVTTKMILMMTISPKRKSLMD